MKTTASYTAPAARTHCGRTLHRMPTQAEYIAECMRLEARLYRASTSRRPTVRRFSWEGEA